MPAEKALDLAAGRCLRCQEVPRGCGSRPLLCGGLVPANMHPRRFKEPADRAEHLLHEGQCSIRWRKGVIRDAKMIKGARRRLPTLDVPIPELRIGGQSRHDMSRQFNLRHHLDVALLRVRHDVTNLLLGVGLPAAEALRTDLRELRVAVDWQPPTLVVGEVPMEAVELEGGHGVKKELHLLRPEEVPAHVEKETTPLEARRILDQHLRQLLSVRARLHQLPQGLHAVEEAGERRRHQLNLMFPDLQNVALGRLRLVKHDLKMHDATNMCGTPGAVRPHLPLPLKSLPQRRHRQVVFRDALPDLHLDAALEAEWRRLQRKSHERRVRYQRQWHFLHCRSGRRRRRAGVRAHLQHLQH
mmetsp:Transcript_44492/g.114504  ORF Transcript_44492/g.114504 Transcript_44492/m.114504 type:complete len:357 (+) Transcript_44492:702-1772(+)